MLPVLDSIISFFDLLENFMVVYLDAARIRFNHSLFDVCDNFAIVVLEK